MSSRPQPNNHVVVYDNNSNSFNSFNNGNNGNTLQPRSAKCPRSPRPSNHAVLSHPIKCPRIILNHDDEDDYETEQTGDLFSSVQQHGDTNSTGIVLHSDQKAEDLALKVRTFGLFSIVLEVTKHIPDFSNVVCSFKDLTAPEVLNAFENRKDGIPLNRKKTFVEFMIYQCACDRRSLGHSILHVTSLDVPFCVDQLFFEEDGMTIQVVSKSEMIQECMKLFVKTKLLNGPVLEVENDMKILSNHPFFMLSCTLDDGTLKSASVFRVHLLNNNTRLLSLEMLASDTSHGAGGGTTMMKMLRDISMLSPRHVGHICACTLKTPDAVQFYKRQLPSKNSPQDRAFHLSIAFLDTSYRIYSHLDLRSTAVWPVFGL